MWRSVVAVVLVITLIQPESASAQLNVAIENVNVDVGNLSIPIHLPPTAWASLAMSVGSLLLAESQNAQMANRLDRIDAKLGEILARVTEMNQKLDTISAKLTFISERLTELQNAVERQAPRAAAMQVAGQLATIRASMPDYQSSPRRKRSEIEQALRELRRLTNTLMQYDEPDYFLTVGAAMLVERDLAMLVSESNVTMSRELDGFVRYFRRISEAADAARVDAAVVSGDSFPMRESKYRKQLQVLMPLAKTTDTTIWTGTTTSANWVCQFDRYYPDRASLSVRRLYQYAFPLGEGEFILPLTTTGEINVCFRPRPEQMLLQYTGAPIYFNNAVVTNSSMVLHGYWWILAGVTVDQQSGRFAATSPFYHPSNINDCYSTCTAACRPTAPPGSHIAASYGVECIYGLNAGEAVTLQSYAANMSPMMPGHRHHIAALQARIGSANNLLALIHESRASAAATQDLLKSAEQIRKGFETGRTRS